MTKNDYSRLEELSLTYAKDKLRDAEHARRVLYNALRIAESEGTVDYEVLIAASLLHDIGKSRLVGKKQNQDHAAAGAAEAYKLLRRLGWSDDKAQRAKACIETHRRKSKKAPVSLEARILYDADKLDSLGAIGVARRLMYSGLQNSAALYTLGEENRLLADDKDSFLNDYPSKAEKLMACLHTDAAKHLAEDCGRRASAFLADLTEEINETLSAGHRLVSKCIDDSKQ